jgi:hypothetical protein
MLDEGQFRGSLEWRFVAQAGDTSLGSLKSSEILRNRE